jgi:hypothetical protein
MDRVQESVAGVEQQTRESAPRLKPRYTGDVRATDEAIAAVNTPALNQKPAMRHVACLVQTLTSLFKPKFGGWLDVGRHGR